MPRHPKPQPSGPPPWLRPVVLGLAAILLLAWLSREGGDSDSWWHLKSGQFILQHHRLPVPDQFAYTTYLGKPAYPGEETTRYFNLTMEWLAEVVMYVAYAAGGLTALVLMRSVCLSLFCALAGLMAYRRTGGVYRALAATFATAFVLHSFTADRPQYFTLLFVALTINLLDARRWLWSLPPLFLIWANCHAGFFLGWVVVGIYLAESLYLRRASHVASRNRRHPDLRPESQRVRRLTHPGQLPSEPNDLADLGMVSAGTGRAQPVHGTSLRRPADLVVAAPQDASGGLAAARRLRLGRTPRYPQCSAHLLRGRISDRGVSARCQARPSHRRLGAGRGTARRDCRPDRPRPRVPIPRLCPHPGRRRRFPRAAPHSREDVQYLEPGRIFIWRLWPQLPVFIDGRVLNESVAADAQRILFAADTTGGKSYDALLNDYGIDIIVMECFEPVRGAAYYLPAALADPQQTDWKLVYRDAHDLIYMRHPPPDIQPLNTLDGLDGMEDQCSFLMSDGAPACAKGMVDVFSRIGDQARAQKWELILENARLE
jgi:hypothetical protein